MNDEELQLQGAASAYDSQVDLQVLVKFVRAHRVLLLLATVLGAVSGVAYSFTFQPIYRADAVLIAGGDDFGGAGSLGEADGGALGGLGGAASLLGLSKPANRLTESIAILKSRTLIESYIADRHLLPVLFPKQWDSEHQTWRSKDPKKIPKMGSAFNYFSQKVLRVYEDKKTGLVTITVDWSDPAVAAQWASDLVERTNSLLRNRAIERGERNLAYLNEQLDKTSVIEVRSAIYKLVENEIKKLMLAEGSKDYAFRYVDPPVVPERRVFPKRGHFLIMGAIAGLLGGALLAYFRSRSLPSRPVT